MVNAFTNFQIGFIFSIRNYCKKKKIHNISSACLTLNILKNILTITAKNICSHCTVQDIETAWKAIPYNVNMTIRCLVKLKILSNHITTFSPRNPENISNFEGEDWSYNQLSFMTIIFWDFLMFYRIFLSPQMKQCAIITYKHGVYKLPRELPNDLRLRKSRNIKKVSKLHRRIA